MPHLLLLLPLPHLHQPPPRRLLLLSPWTPPRLRLLPPPPPHSQMGQPHNPGPSKAALYAGLDVQRPQTPAPLTPALALIR